MNLTDETKKGACLCRSCKNVFKSNKIEHKYIERNGQLVYEAICPYCNSTYFGLIDYPVKEEKLIYNNSNYPSELVKRLDQVTDDITEEDKKIAKAVAKAKRANERYLKKYGLL